MFKAKESLFLHVESTPMKIIIPSISQRYTVYRRTLFKCESVIIANCEFFPQSHLKERNKRVSHVQTT